MSNFMIIYVLAFELMFDRIPIAIVMEFHAPI
jgi:hypothetical protein